MAESVVPIGVDGKALFPHHTLVRTPRPAAVLLCGRASWAGTVVSNHRIDPNPIFSLNKILWVKRTLPRDLRESSRLAAEWQTISIYSSPASRLQTPPLACRTLAYDLDKAAWSEEILAAVGVSPHIFPRVGENGSVIGAVTRPPAPLPGCAPGPRIALGGNDHPCATIAAAGVLLGNKILTRAAQHKLQDSCISFQKQRNCTGSSREGGCAATWRQTVMPSGEDHFLRGIHRLGVQPPGRYPPTRATPGPRPATRK